MGKKKFNTSQAIKELFDNLGENEKLLVLHDNGNELNIGVSDKEDITYAIASIMTISLTEKGERGFDKLTNIILDATELVRQEPIAGMNLLTRQMEDILKRGKAEKAMKERDTAKESPCADCDKVYTCMDKDAIDYRKKHHLPKPKKGKMSK